MEKKIKLAETMLENAGHTATKGRIEALAQFITLHPDCKVSIVENNNWKNPPKKQQLLHWAHIGGVTYKYQLWAVVFDSNGDCR
jgi:hypothetical protein